ncbi:MAG: hypothetical protein PHP42_10495 [Bacteroidota bacterium]|nr:hypothetical protein [Bacteroidota bacterium]
MELRPVSLAGIITEVRELVNHTFPKNITITSSSENESGNILGDPNYLHQIILNLAINARDAMPQE